MNTSFRLDPRYYQRGQTWSECLASWNHERVNFLARVHEAPILPSFFQRLNELPVGSRFMMVYDAYLADTRKLLPALGHTLNQATHLSCRYFDVDVFFPDFQTIFGRQLPCIAFVDHSGLIQKPWGPRPHTLTDAINVTEFLDANQRLTWLLAYEQAVYDQQLDTELTSFSQNWASFY